MGEKDASILTPRIDPLHLEEQLVPRPRGYRSAPGEKGRSYGRRACPTGTVAVSTAAGLGG
jgi:hypothetical protein